METTYKQQTPPPDRRGSDKVRKFVAYCREHPDTWFVYSDTYKGTWRKTKDLDMEWTTRASEALPGNRTVYGRCVTL